MDSPIRERRHRLPPQSYRGNVIAAFTLNTRNRIRYFGRALPVQTATTALAEAFVLHHGHAGVYVIMPDHLHLMVSGEDAQADLLALVKDFKQKVTFRVHQQGESFEWQKDFYDHIVRANEDYGAQVRYLLRNPVRWRLCERWQDWPHKGVLGQTWEQLAVATATL